MKRILTSLTFLAIVVMGGTAMAQAEAVDQELCWFAPAKDGVDSMQCFNGRKIDINYAKADVKQILAVIDVALEAFKQQERGQTITVSLK